MGEPENPMGELVEPMLVGDTGTAFDKLRQRIFNMIR